MKSTLLIFFLIALAASGVLAFALIRTSPLGAQLIPGTSHTSAQSSYSWSFPFQVQHSGFYVISASWNSSVLSQVHILILFTREGDGKTVSVDIHHLHQVIRLDSGYYEVTVFLSARTNLSPQELQNQVNISITYIGHDMGHEEEDHSTYFVVGSNWIYDRGQGPKEELRRF